MPVGWARRFSFSESNAPGSDVPLGLRIASTVLRVAFIALLLVVTVRVSMPQNETIWTAYDTPGDLVRMALGLVVCIWIAVQLFAAPKDAHGHRTWIYLGLVAVPFALICIIGTW
jgi:archaellum biogenesis protein FlaJ (TadC family)